MKRYIAATHKFRKSLDASWKEGVASAVMISVTDYYLIPLALFLGGGPLQVGLLVAVPQLLGAISQLISVRMVRWVGSRRNFLVFGSLTQAILLSPIALLPFLSLPHRVEILVMLVSIFRVVGSLIGTVWGSLVSDYLKSEERGSYIGWRSQITGLAGVGGLLSGGLLLFFMRPYSPALAFALLFAFTAASRFISSALMKQLEEVPLKHPAEAEFTFMQFLKRFRESNFVKFVLYVACITFSTNLAAPYFSVFMLRDLKLDYLAYMLLHLAAVVASLISFPLWGRHADQVGNAHILKLTGLVVPFIPVFWTFSHSVGYLVALELIAGFFWGGFNLCSVNFIFDAVHPEKRVRCLSYFNLINGVALFLGASLGGYLAGHITPYRGYALYSLFLLSGLLRMLSYAFLSRHFKEVRATKQKVSSLELFFGVIGVRPLLGRNRFVEGISGLGREKSASGAE